MVPIGVVQTGRDEWDVVYGGVLLGVLEDHDGEFMFTDTFGIQHEYDDVFDLEEAVMAIGAQHKPQYLN